MEGKQKTVYSDLLSSFDKNSKVSVSATRGSGGRTQKRMYDLGLREARAPSRVAVDDWRPLKPLGEVPDGLEGRHPGLLGHLLLLLLRRGSHVRAFDDEKRNAGGFVPAGVHGSSTRRLGLCCAGCCQGSWW